MKQTYYKNWYQHYKSVQDEQYKQKQQAYFSDTFSSSKNFPIELDVPRVRNYRQERDERHLPEHTSHYTHIKPKRKSSGFLGLLLPLTTIAGFLFLWHMLGISPFGFTPVDLVPDRVVAFVSDVFDDRDETDDIDNYIVAHHDLMELHTEINDSISAQIRGETLDFDMQILYDYVERENALLVNRLDTSDEDLIRLWSLKMQSLSTMMQYLDDPEAAAAYYDRFLEDQDVIATFLHEAVADLTKTN